MLPFLMVVVFCVCFLSSLIKDYSAAMLMISWVLPLICFFVSVIYGINNSFNPFYVIFVMVLVTPIIYLRIPLLWDFAIVYGVATLLGNAVGMILHKKNVRIRVIERYGQRFVVIAAISITIVYAVAVIVSTVMVNQMTEITYRATAYGVTIREDVVSFEMNSSQRSYYGFDGEIKSTEESAIDIAEKRKIRLICSFSLFPLWQKSYYNPYVMDGDQYIIERTYGDNSSLIHGGNAYPLTYRLVMWAIENAMV